MKSMTHIWWKGGGESTEPDSEQAQTLDLLSKDIKSVIYIWTKNF